MSDNAIYGFANWRPGDGQVISIIVAYDEDRAIAKDGQIPWHIKDDFRHFKKTTLGCPVVMGRKTWDSLPKKPLPDRSNIVITSGPGRYNPPVLSAGCLEEALWIAGEADPGKEIFIIGGERVYKEALASGIVEKVVASHIKGRFGGDLFFPELDGWQCRLIKSYTEFEVFEYTKIKA